MIIIGVDPGPTTGIVELVWEGLGCVPGRVCQCGASAALSILDAWLTPHAGTLQPGHFDLRTLSWLAVERFVDGRHAGRGNAPSAGRTTRDLVAAIESRFAPLSHVCVVLRSASEVKPWASDVRLDRAGLLAPTKGMTHARDAARHALFAAVRNGALDPLARAGSVDR